MSNANEPVDGPEQSGPSPAPSSNRRRNALIGGLVLAVAVGAGAYSVLGEDETGAADPALAGGRWTIPDRPDPGVRDTLRGLFDGDSVREAAVQEMIRRCMRKSGFDYVKNPVAPRDIAPTIGNDHYGISLAEAERYGYGKYRAKDLEGNADPSREGRQGQQNLSPSDRKRWEATLVGDWSRTIKVQLPDGSETGTPDNGCIAEARKAVFGSLEAELKLTQLAGNLPIWARKQATSDPAFQTLNRKWSECVKALGKGDFASPEALRARADELVKDSPDQAEPVDRPLAVAEARCDAKIGYTPQRRLLEDRYYTAGLRKYEGEVAAIQEMNREALARARRLLSGQGE